MYSISILDLQYFQELHDKRYHADIYSKPLMQRLTHLHNHLIKYSANDLVRNSKYPDALACILSMANALNFDISNGLTKLQKVATNNLDHIKGLYKRDLLINFYRTQLGYISKLLEGYDHVESLQYKNDLCKHLTELFGIFIQIYDEIDDGIVSCLQTEYVANIFALKKNHIFHAHYHDADLKDPKYRSFVTINSLNY